ncbi:unnamed protein product [Orchesella dallaii]|uniref:Uncharacterized protein n=1 Tax=Orchesella dallaii TaxID=48710 RepID=A0ABP1Q8L0_9HEXA
MSLLPTTRINTLVSSTSNGVGDPSIPGQDEDILLVDFQPVVVVPNCNQVLSSPSTATTTPMYPIPPPGSLLPGAHMVGINHHPSISSDGITTPHSATGSSGKTHNPNNFSLVSLSNHHAHHNNNTSREESDLNYPQYHPHLPHTTTATAVTQANLPYDENDEFAKHQALSQPTYMMNKRRSRRFITRDNHMWDNSNHVGHHLQQPQPHMSSSLSSSEDSDTGFLMGTRKTAYTRRSVQRVVDPHPPPVVGGNGSPSASTGLLPNLGNRKRVRRRRPSARNRKPVNSQRDKIPNPGDVLSFCCCLCDDDQPSHSSNRSSNASSFKNRYFRLACLVIIIIVIAVLASITVSLQRKVESLDGNLKKLDQAMGSPLLSDSSNGANKTPKSTESFETLLAANNALNTTVINLKAQLDQISGKLQDLQKQLNAATSKPDAVAEVRGDLAKLGSRVEELSSIVKEKLKDATQNANGKENGAANEAKPTASTS